MFESDGALPSAKVCYEQARIRSVVIDEWENLVRMCDLEGKLSVKDTRSDVDIAHQQQTGASRGKNNLDDDSFSHFSKGIHDDPQQTDTSMHLHEGMLATWCPRKMNWPDLLTVDEAWQYV